MSGGVAAVLSRMATIEARFGVAPAPRAAAAVSTSAAATAVPSFESTLSTELASAPRAASVVPSVSSGSGGDYSSLFASAGAAHGVDPALLAAVARTESGLDPTAVSPAGAQGLMQLMPGTAAELGVTDPFDPAQAVDGAARLLRSHLDRFGSVDLALAAYNAGPGAVSRHGGIPPYAETQTYVQRVLATYRGSTS